MRILPIILVFAFAAAGCPERKVEPAAATKAEAPLNLDKPDQARIQLDLAAVRAAIQRLQQTGAPCPETIEELGVKLNYPSDLEYDPTTASVTSKTYPAF
jgi:hypothetical protein